MVKRFRSASRAGSRRRVFRRIGKRRFSRRGRRGKADYGGSRIGRVMQYTDSANFPPSDQGIGGLVRSFTLNYQPQLATSSLGNTGPATYGTPPAGPNWGTYYRQPVTVNELGALGQATGSTLWPPGRYSYSTAGVPYERSDYRTGLTVNYAFSVGQIPATRFLLWSILYSQVRLRKVHFKMWSHQVTRVNSLPTAAMSTATSQLVTTFNGVGAITESNPSVYRLPYNVAAHERGGNLVAACTRFKGPVVEQEAVTNFIGSPDELYKTAYGQLKQDIRSRRSAQWRNDVAFGMRPIKFSFRPTMLNPKWNRNLALTQVVNSVAPAGPDYNRLAGSQWKYVPSQWLDMVVTDPATAGGAGFASTAHYTSTGWYDVPHFGVCVAIQPGSATVWPTNIRTQISYELEFRGPRNFIADAVSGGPGNFFTDWGNLPTFQSK